MEKVKITQEQANVIERMKEKHLEGLEDLFANPDDYDISDFHRPLFELTPNQCFDAMYIGYEVEETFKVGDWVVIRFGGKQWVTDLAREGEGGGFYTDSTLPNVKQEYFSHSLLRHATPEEIAKEKQRRWWAKHDRKVWELRKGDVILNVLSEKLYEVTRQEADGTVRMRFDNIGVNRDLTFLKDICKVACFVEDRKDLE